MNGRKGTSREALQLLMDALGLSSSVVSTDPVQLRGQLAGRLVGVRLEEIRKLLDRIRGAAGGPWLRPLAPTLVSPGGMLRWVLHDDFYSVAITPDDSRVLADDGGVVKVMDLRSGREMASFAGPLDGVDWVSFAPDGTRAVFLDFEGRIRVWDLERWVELKCLRDSTGGLMVLSRDGHLGVAPGAGGRRSIGVWDLDQGAVIKTLERGGLPVCLSGNCGHVVVREGGTLSLVSLTDGQEIRSFDVGGGVVGVCLHRMIALASNRPDGWSTDHAISMWDLESGCTVGDLVGHRDSVNCLAISANGRSAVSGSRDGTVRVWDLDSRTTTTVLRHGPGPRDALGSGSGFRTGGVASVAMSGDGRTVLSVGGSQLRAWTLPKIRPCRVLTGHEGEVKHLSISPDGKRLATAGSDSRLRIWDTETWRSTLVPEFTGGQCRGISFSPGRRDVLSSWDEDFLATMEENATRTAAARGIFLTDPEEGTTQLLSEEGLLIGSMSVAPDGSWVMSGGYERYLWRLLGDGRLEVLSDDEGWERQVLADIARIGVATLTPDGRQALSSDFCQEEHDVPLVRLWSMESDEVERTFEGHTENIEDLAVTPDGTRFLSASTDTTARLWSLESGEVLQVLWGHAGAVNSVGVSPDGQLAVTGSQDGTVMVWDLGTGEAVRVLEGHTGAVNQVAVTPDGRSVVSASDDHTVRVWDLESSGGSPGRERVQDPVTAVAVAREAPRALSVSGRKVTVWDLSTLSVVMQREYPWRRMGGDGALGPHGESALTIVLASQDQPAGLLEWGLGENDVIEHSIDEIVCHAGPRHDYDIKAAAFLPDLSLALCGCGDHTVRLWRMHRRAWLVTEYSSGLHAEGEEIWCAESHSETIQALALAEDGRKGVSGSRDRTVRGWDLESGTELWALEGHSSGVTAVAITSARDLAVSGDAGGVIKAWDLAHASVEGSPHGRPPCVWTMRLHKGPVTRITMTPDTRHGISASRDKGVRVWNLRRGETVAALTLEAAALDCAVCPDSRTIVVGDETGHVHFLELCGQRRAFR